MTNRPTLDDITDDPGKLDKLPLDVIALLIEDAKAAKSRAATASNVLNSALETRFQSAIAGTYQAAQKDTGTVHIEAGDGFEIEATRTKKVEWSQTELSKIGDKIAAEGDDPHEYISTTYGVDERKFTAWPEHIRKVFEPARTLKPGSLALKLKMKEAA